MNHKVWFSVAAMAGLVAVIPLIAAMQSLMIWLPWTVFGIGKTYFAFLPEPWQAPSFIDWILIAMVGGVLRQWVGLTKVKAVEE